MNEILMVGVAGMALLAVVLTLTFGGFARVGPVTHLKLSASVTKFVGIEIELKADRHQMVDGTQGCVPGNQGNPTCASNGHRGRRR